MFKLLGYQMAALIIAMIISYAVGGDGILLSVLLGGMCYFIPSCVASLFLYYTNKDIQYMALGFVLGESLKIILAILMIVGVILVYSTLNWLYFFMGFLAVSHVIFIVFGKLKSYGTNSC
jgi:ATP synthase protein I